jgi:hypothetical protein
MEKTEMAKRNKEDLSPQEKLFCEKYAEIGGDCYSNGTQAAIAAKYSKKSAHSCAWRLLRRPAIRQYLQHRWKDNCAEHNVTPHRVLSDLEDARRRAMAKGDYSVVTRCIELTGKYLSMWTEKFYFGTDEEQVKLDAHRAAAAREISEEILRRELQGKKDAG